MASREKEAREILLYVLDWHEWCSYPHRCGTCRGIVHEDCIDRNITDPKVVLCDGCEMLVRAKTWLEAK